MISLFLTGFTQVLLVTIQTYFITKVFYPGVLIVGFLISYVWTWNVKKVAFGTKADRVVYSAGAASGALVGLMLSAFVYSFI